MRKQEQMFERFQKMFDAAPADAFERLIASVFQRMGVPMSNTKAKAYQIKFPDQSIFFITEKAGGWFEISTELGALPQRDHEAALALLILQRQQGDGPLVGIGISSEPHVVHVYARLRAGFCHPEDVIATTQLVRARASEVKALLGNGAAF